MIEYSNAQIMALKSAFAIVALAALVALWYVSRLPTRATGDEQAAMAQQEATTA